jgi:AraC-like DNA-binding protein
MPGMPGRQRGELLTRIGVRDHAHRVHAQRLEGPQRRAHPAALRDDAGGTTGLIGISRDLEAANERSADYLQVASAVRWIQTRYAERLQVVDLARRARLSVYQFDKRLRRIFGITAGQLIRKTRLDAALPRLRETGASIASIASDCGYADQSAFTRRFRETTGMTPSEYRAAGR